MLFKDKKAQTKLKKQNVQGTNLWTYHGQVFVSKTTWAPMVE